MEIDGFIMPVDVDYLIFSWICDEDEEYISNRRKNHMVRQVSKLTRCSAGCANHPPVPAILSGDPGTGAVSEGATAASGGGDEDLRGR